MRVRKRSGPDYCITWQRHGPHIMSRRHIKALETFHMRWLKWFCEAGGGSPDEARLEQTHTHSNPTNFALFRHKITLHRFNQGGSYYCRGLKWEQGWAEPPSPLTLTTGQTEP